MFGFDSNLSSRMQLGSVVSQQRRRALGVIYELNRDGLLLSGPNGRGFVDARSVSRRLLPGVTPHISAAPRQRIKRVFKQHGVNTRAIRFFRFGHHQSRSLTSDFHAGRVVHRALMHELTCKAPPLSGIVSPRFPISAPFDGGRCRCVDVHGRINVKASERPLLNAYVSAARDFIAAERLRPVMAEQVIVDDKMGTRFDALMSRHNSATNTEEIFIVSWKTGGAALYKTAPTKAEQNVQDGRREGYIAQVLYEAALLQDCFGVKVDGAFIVNLLSTTDGPAGYYMTLSSDLMQVAGRVHTELKRLQDGVILRKKR